MIDLAPASGGLAPASGGLAPASGGLAPASGGLVPASSGLVPASSGLVPASSLAQTSVGKNSSFVGNTTRTSPSNSILVLAKMRRSADTSPEFIMLVMSLFSGTLELNMMDPAAVTTSIALISSAHSCNARPKLLKNVKCH